MANDGSTIAAQMADVDRVTNDIDGIRVPMTDDDDGTRVSMKVTDGVTDDGTRVSMKIVDVVPIDVKDRVTMGVVDGVSIEVPDRVPIKVADTSISMKVRVPMEIVPCTVFTGFLGI